METRLPNSDTESVLSPSQSLALMAAGRHHKFESVLFSPQLFATMLLKAHVTAAV